MRNDKIIPGIVLIMIGAIILLNNYGVIHFHWHNFFYLWPIFIVIAGINLIFANNRAPWATALKIGVLALGFGLILFGNYGKNHRFLNSDAFYFNDDNDNGDDDDNGRKGVTKIEGNSQFNAPYSPSIKVAHLNISGGGTSYHLSDTTGQLLAATTHEHNGSYLFDHYQSDSTYIMNFKMKGRHGFNIDIDDDDKKDSSKNNSVTFKLNTAPIWELDIKTGATALGFDLAKFKVRSLKLSGGAAAFDVKLGQPLAATNVNVSTGMSEVVIRIPANAACQVVSSTGLSSTNFEGLNKLSDGTYQTPGFANAANKFYIKMSGGMADFKVKRY